MQTENKNWVITVEKDEETGDLILPLPQDLLESKGWKTGDVLVWKDLGNGSWELSKKENEEKKND
jgi:hypothetical protein